MNGHEPRYAKHALVAEMLETQAVCSEIPVERIRKLPSPGDTPFLVGEGSSRIFPAKRAIHAALLRGDRTVPRTESAHGARELDLNGRSVYVASNSGKTAECVHLIHTLREKQHEGRIIGLAGGASSPVAQQSDEAYILTCGTEHAVAATKSVVEQALVYDLHFRMQEGHPLPDLKRLGEDMTAAMKAHIPVELIEAVAAAPTIYFAGRDDGVAEELALKANEIVRARSDFLPGTYAVHGIEEVMEPGDVLIWIDPPVDYEQKFDEVLQKGVGLKVFAVASRETSFPTVRIPEPADRATAAYVQLAMGWNILVEAGVSLGINLDKPNRARKVGNEFVADESGDE
ncbi:MAG: SIS domain-containing protein [Spirochaetia bacterium]